MAQRLWLAGVLAGCLAALPVFSARSGPQLSDEEKILHALNRLTFGPRPGEVAQVKSMGLKKWINLQLHPDRIPESPALEARLAPLDTLRMSPEERVANYPPPQVVRAMVEGRVPFPQDPDKRMMIRRLAERFEQTSGKGADDQAKPELAAILTVSERRTLRNAAPEEKVAWLRGLPLEKQDQVLEAMPAGMRRALYPAAPPELRRKIEWVSGPLQVVAADLQEAKLYRVLYSNRQLEQVLVDFWYNHFNVFLNKGADRYLVTSYERDAVRPHVLGKFYDLLLATAQSPAMLFYLDNWQSVDPNREVKLFLAGRTAGKSARRGLNENYARELMELHTLGADGGYTQKDVTEVARCFTGWTIRNPRQGGSFFFNPRMHDPGAKVVLGVQIPAGGGIEDGLRVLEILAHHPATARHISYQLAQRFAADNPPASMVSRMSLTFLEKDGDLREVMKTMLAAPEFWAPETFRAKSKSPLEMVASAVRALDADVDYGFALANQLAQLGEPLYRKQEPTGYSNAGQDWMNSAGLLARMNFALALARNQVPGVRVDQARFGDEGVHLGSPEFQRK
ncbi:MAG TPA: DUF1800 domain-containing protein [Bryobacteraceae bacterium]|nr:DUF1800 domain-containing protein [Bryobacteraceae bacterium]